MNPEPTQSPQDARTSRDTLYTPRSAPSVVHPRAHPVGTVRSRVLLSLLLLVAAALLLRLDRSDPAGSSLTPLAVQQPLEGADAARIRLSGRDADLRIGVGPLAGLALSGRTVFPENTALERRAERTGDLVDLEWSERLAYRGIVNLSWNRPSPRWEVQLNRELPTALGVTLESGDATLLLEDARLRSLEAHTRSGELRVELPARMAGNATVSTGSGDLKVSSPLEPRPPLSATGEDLSFQARTGSGEQRIDLSGSDFAQVQVQSGSGDLTLTLPRRSRVNARLSVGSGALTVRAPAQVRGGVLSLRSGSGDLELSLPQDAAVSAIVRGPEEGLQVPEGYARVGGRYLSRAALARTEAQDGPLLTVTLETSSGEIRLIAEPGSEAEPR